MRKKVLFLSFVLATSLFADANKERVSNKNTKLNIQTGTTIQSENLKSCSSEYIIVDNITKEVLSYDGVGEIVSSQDFLLNSLGIVMNRRGNNLNSFSFFTDGFYLNDTVYSFESELSDSYINLVLKENFINHVVCKRERLLKHAFTEDKPSVINAVQVSKDEQLAILRYMLEISMLDVLEDADGGLLISLNEKYAPKNWLDIDDLNKRAEELKIKNDERYNKLNEIEKNEHKKWLEARKHNEYAVLTVRKDYLVKAENMKKVREELK